MITRHEIIQIAKRSIKNFSFTPTNYTFKENKIIVNGYKKNNSILFKNEITGSIKVHFNKTTGSRVFIGENFKGSLAININKNDSTIYIGDNCTFNNVKIKSEENNDCIFIGNSVSSSGQVNFRSGLRSGNDTSGIVIGDDCMFSSSITVRNTDAHPVFSIKTLEQVNKPKNIIHIEPHVWIGQNVIITKNVEIGACSILGAGAVVTKSTPRFSKIVGVPAKYTIDKDMFWTRSFTDKAKKSALFFYEKYKEKPTL